MTQALERTGLYSSAQDGFRVPAPKDEDWRFTPTAPFLEERPPAARPEKAPKDAASLRLCDLGGPPAVFVDGHPLSGAAGARVAVADAETLDRPVHLLFVSARPGVASHPRLNISLGEGAKACVVEDYVGAGAGARFSQAFTEITLADGARLEHYRIQRENEETVHAAGLRARLGRDSALVSHCVSLGGALSRNDIRVLLDGEGADATLNGLYLVRGSQHVDFHTVIDHARPHGTSSELYKGVLDGRSRAVFDGSIVVRPAAQKTDARVYNKNLLLSEHGLVNAKPEFKISANDVQCKHGATVGQISPEALFYLRSRGIGREESRRLLVYAFASEMVVRMGLAPVKEALWDLLHARLPEA